MRMKKTLKAVIAVALASSLFAMPVSAHGHHGQARVTDTSCPVCTVEGCTEEGKHSHDGHEYCGYDHADGYCDGSCETVKKTVSKRVCGSRRHCSH